MAGAVNDCSFKMMVWLTIYYEFFDKKVTFRHFKSWHKTVIFAYVIIFMQRVSPTLCKIIGEDSFCQLANLRVHEVRLFKSFLDTSNLISEPEEPDPLRHDQEVLELLPNGRHRRKSRATTSNMVDPLYELFLPPPSSPIGKQDILSCADLNFCLLVRA